MSNYVLTFCSMVSTSRRVMKRCRSWRPEANLWDEDGLLAATAYFGMGAQEATGLDHNFVVSTRKLSVLVATMDVLGDDPVERQARG